METKPQQKKTVLVHIGPHKTGSTAIQKALGANKAALGAVGITFLQTRATHEAALCLADGLFDVAEPKLNLISQDISSCPGKTVILSHEDFCGHIPGRLQGKTIYPRVKKNLRVIRRALSPHNVRFAVFLRGDEEWLHSCYHQHLMYRTRFATYQSFKEFFTANNSLRAIIDGVQAEMGSQIIVIPYEKSRDAGTRALLTAIGHADLHLPAAPTTQNASPDATKIALLERVNALSSFRPTAWFAKKLILQDWKPAYAGKTVDTGSPTSDVTASIALPDLLARVKTHTWRQDTEDILPPADVDLTQLAAQILDTSVTLPDVSRAAIRDQDKLLLYHLRGKSELAKLNALTISYLRRRTPHTAKARALFHRIWQEQGVLLINELSTRWLISTLQTFLDHGLDEPQRLIGACGYFYGNLMKIYEGERSIEGLKQDGELAALSPQTVNKFPGLDRYTVGGTDLLLNTNAMALDLSRRDEVAGLVLQELLLRTKHSANVFTRNDRKRLASNQTVEGFENAWSFFVKPG